jgi:hypothetical protein
LLLLKLQKILLAGVDGGLYLCPFLLQIGQLFVD